METTTHNNYDRVAWFYETASQAYSGGQIRACKRAQLAAIAPGDRVLYAGAGGGEDAELAARHGARVTVVELSHEMVVRTRKRLERAGLAADVELIHADVFDHGRTDHYDVVAANFFLNVFSGERMRSVLAHLVTSIRPGGKLLIADFAVPTGSEWAQRSQRLYYGAAALAFRLLAHNPLHPIYDYREVLGDLGLELCATEEFRILSRGPARYWTLTATRT